MAASAGIAAVPTAARKSEMAVDAKLTPASAAVSTASDFKFPEFYSFPPFFTVQPVLATRQKQLRMWSELILYYLAAHHQSHLILADEQKKPLFYNAKIDRKLSIDLIRALIDDLIRQGYGEWLDEKKSSSIISWKKIDDWAAVLWKWAKANNLVNAITTIYDLAAGDESREAEFFGVDHRLLLRALTVLEKQGRVTLMRGANVAETGVKFHDL